MRGVGNNKCKCINVCWLQCYQFKERDMLEGIFKFWRGSAPFDMAKCWSVYSKLSDASVVLLTD